LSIRIILLGITMGVALAARAEAQLQQTTLTAIVTDAKQAAVAGARVTLTDPLGAELQTATTDARGHAVFANVSPGRYELRTIASGAAPLHLPVTIAAALPMEIAIGIPAAVTDRVVVSGVLADESSSRGSIAGESISRVPVRVRSRALQDVLATLPGWSTEDNGLLHARGVDDGFLYVIDGVPVYERVDAVSGLAPDLTSVASINVVTGYVPPEFGYKAGGVIEIRSATAQSWTGTAEVSGADDDARDVSGIVGGRLTDEISFRVGGVAARSDRFLDPVHPDNLHNSGNQASTFGQLEWAATTTDRLSVGWEAGRSRFGVPNNAEQEDAGQDQRQRIGQGSLNLSWQRTWSENLVTQAGFYHRRTRSRLDGSAFDTPLEAHANRTLHRTGALFAATRQYGQHVAKAGFEWQRLWMKELFQFAITDEDAAEDAGFREEALEFTPANPFSFDGDESPTLFSAFVQDSWHVLPQVTLSGGLRLDRSELLLTRTQVSPRVGAAIRVAEGTLLRAAASRFFQPPQPENLLLSSSPEARVLSSIEVGEDVGGAEVEPERQWASELGVEQQIVGRARLELSYWTRRMRDVADPNVFAGTTIIFPNAVAKGRAHGFEARLEMRKHRGWSGYGNWAVARVVQTGPITGGLFLEDDIEELGPGVEFAPDHDQRFTAGGGVTWEHARSRAAVSLAARYETGTPVQQDEDELDELLEQPGGDLVDVDSGRVKPRTVVSLLFTAPVFSAGRVEASLGVQVLNLFDQRYAYNFGNPFSGTHFGAPRTVAVSARFAFR
jgi:outer membrane receptor protein involved in Fe transport